MKTKRNLKPVLLLLVAVVFCSAFVAKLKYRPMGIFTLKGDFHLEQFEYAPYSADSLQANEVEFITRLGTSTKRFNPVLSKYVQQALGKELKACGMNETENASLVISGVIKVLKIESYAEKSIAQMQLDFELRQADNKKLTFSCQGKRQYQEVIAIATTEYRKMVQDVTKQCFKQFIQEAEEKGFFKD